MKTVTPIALPSNTSKAVKEHVEILHTANEALAMENDDLACKINAISTAIAERFDKDGVDDIEIPTRFTFWWVLRNSTRIYKLVTDIIDIIKKPCTQNDAI